jgi:hypothetical protein
MTNSNSSKNAVSHGAYSREVVLPWENAQDFNNLHEDLQNEYFPNGRSEEEAVLELAELHWRKRRLNVGSRLAFLRDRDISGLTEAGRNNGWEGIADYFAKTLDNNESTRETMRSLNKSLREVVVASHGVATKHMERMLAPDRANQEGKESAAAEFENVNLLINEMKAGVSVIGAQLRALESFGLDERVCERAYRPEVMERELKILAEIDKRIEKTITRLVVLKDLKKLYSPKEVKALPTETIGLPAKQP